MLQTKGICVRTGKLPRAWLKTKNFNSKAVFLILVKSIENRRKIRKMQTNFVGRLVKNTTTFLKLVYAFF
jgi:hypothetical protein